MSWTCNGCHNDFKQRPLCWSCRALIDTAAARLEAFKEARHRVLRIMKFWYGYGHEPTEEISALFDRIEAEERAKGGT